MNQDDLLKSIRKTAKKHGRAGDNSYNFSVSHIIKDFPIGIEPEFPEIIEALSKLMRRQSDGFKLGFVIEDRGPRDITGERYPLRFFVEKIS